MPVGGDGGGDAAAVHWPHATGQIDLISAPCVAWLQFDVSCEQEAGLPLMVNPVLDESTHVLAEPLLPAPVERVPQSVQSEPYAHIEN